MASQKKVAVPPTTSKIEQLPEPDFHQKDKAGVEPTEVPDASVHREN